MTIDPTTGHERDYPRKGRGQAMSRAMDGLVDLMEAEYGTERAAWMLARRALLYLEKGRRPPRAVDFQVKLKSIETQLKRLSRVTSVKPPQQPTTPTPMMIIQMGDELIVGVTGKTRRKLMEAGFTDFNRFP